jgi:hypothetical protein
LRLVVSKYSYLETALLVLGFIFFGYLIEPADPLLVHYELIYIVILMTIITMFHGIGNGLLAIFIIALAMDFLYPVFPIEFLLKLFILVLIFGEFHYFWNRKIIQNKSKNSYLRSKLNELSNAFYTLKISHDQLEKNYVFKPMSLRNSIRQLKDAYTEKKDFFKKFLTLLDKSFGVNSAEFCVVKNNKIYSVYDTEFKKKMDSSDPMIEMALAKQSPIYVSSAEVNNNSKFLAVIPAVSDDEVKGLLLITEMPFLSFNKDTLLSISILISYFLDEIEKWNIIEKSATKSPLVDNEFYFELMRLYKISMEFDVQSTMLVLKSKDRLLAHLVLEKARASLRSLDIVSAHHSDDYEVLGILFPFADKTSAEGFLTRLLQLLKLDAKDERIEYSFFDVTDLESIRRYAHLETDNV